MKIFNHRYFAFLLVFIMVFMLFASPISSQKAHAAESVEPITASAALIIWLLGLMGITFTSWDATKMATDNYIDYIQDTDTETYVYVDVLTIAKAWQAANGGGQGGGDEDPDEVKFSGNALNMTAIALIIDSIRRYFSAEETGTIEVDDVYNPNKYFKDAIISTLASTPTANFNQAPYGVNDVVVVGVDFYSWNARKLYITTPSGTSTVCPRDNNYLGYEDGSQYEYRWGLYQETVGSVTYIQPYGVLRMYTDATHTTVYNDFNDYGNAVPFVRGSIAINASEITFPKTPITYTQNSNYTDQAIKDAMWDKIDKGQPVPIDLTDIATAIDTGTTTQVPTQPQIIIDTGLQPVSQPQTSTQPGTEPSTKIQLDENDFDPPHLDGVGLLDKFPFCVPKDLYLLFSALNAEPIAPKWVIPLTFPIIDYSYDFTLDLAQVDVLRQPLRIGMTLMFLLGLIMVTRKMIKG